MKLRAFFAALLLFSIADARAVILFRTGDPNENTTAPTGDLANSGWQYQGAWGGFLGTPFAPHYFLSAAHIGHQGNFFWNGVTYTVIDQFYDAAGDLQILKVAEPFPFFAPLYSGSDEVGKRIAEFGRGTQRGAEIYLDSIRKGWEWGPGDGRLRWGENIVSGVLPYGADNDLLFANFDENGLPNECHLSVGDSGGAAFIENLGIWKLAGINYAVDGPYYLDAQGGGAFYGALYDSRGYFAFDGSNYVLITGSTPVPSALYPTRVSTRLPWIASVIAESLLALEGDSVSFSYTRLLLPNADLAYVVEQSSDLTNWTASSAPEEVVSTDGSVQRVKQRFARATAARLFLRLRITRP